MSAHPVTWLTVVLNAGAVFRISILITQDVLLDRPRNWLTSNYHGTLVTLATCMWCISFWVAVIAALLTFFFWPVWIWVALVLTLSAVTGALSEHV